MMLTNTRSLLRRRSNSRWLQDKQSSSCCCHLCDPVIDLEEELAGTAWVAGLEEGRNIGPEEGHTDPGAVRSSISENEFGQFNERT